MLSIQLRQAVGTLIANSFNGDKDRVMLARLSKLEFLIELHHQADRVLRGLLLCTILPNA